MPEKILIVFPGVLYPVVGMSQVRTLEQVERLAADFITDVAVMCRDQQSYDAHVEYLKGKCNKVFRLPHPKFSKGKLFRIYRTLLYKLKYRLSGIPVEYTVSSHREVLNRIKKLVHDHDYRLMIVHYWFPAKVFPQLPPSLLKAVDTHYVVQENMEILEKGEYRHARTSLLKKEYEFSLTTQNRYFKNADILIFNSASQKPHIEKLFPEKKLIVTTNGQKLEQYLDYPSGKPDRNLIFYGALSNQFNGKALRVVIEDLLPRIKEKVKDFRTVVIGSGPPEWLKEMDNGTDFTVTGFVEDIRPWLANAYLKLLPLTTASGFRGRAVELLAMGVPLIGTHNALDSLGIQHGIHGYITDDLDEMARIAVDLLENPRKRDEISGNAIRFVRENFTIEATFGRLSGELMKILAKNNENPTLNVRSH